MKELNADSILIAEFNYALESAQQANEDRIKIFTYIFTNTIGVVTALILPGLNSGIDFLKIIPIVLLANFAMGFLALMQLAKLRISWVDSVKAMNKIKDYYIKNLKQSLPDIDNAFLWKAKTIPSANKKNSLAYYMALALMLSNTLSVSFATFIFLQSTIILVFCIILFFLLQLIIWEIFLRNPSTSL